VLVLALLGDRIDSLELGGTKLKLRAAAVQKFALAEESESRGDSVTASRLRAEGHALLGAAGPIALSIRWSAAQWLRARPGRWPWSTSWNVLGSLLENRNSILRKSADGFRKETMSSASLPWP